MAVCIEKKEASDREGYSIAFCNNNNNNGITFSNLDDDEFSPAFNVPDMDISAGTLDRASF